jgi:hypothetical protein
LHEQGRAQLDFPSRAELQPQKQGEAGKRHHKRSSEAEQEGKM